MAKYIWINISRHHSIKAHCCERFLKKIEYPFNKTCIRWKSMPYSIRKYLHEILFEEYEIHQLGSIANFARFVTIQAELGLLSSRWIQYPSIKDFM